jgi:hypothetical protein
MVIQSNIGSKQKMSTKLSIAILQTNPKTSGELHAVAVPSTVLVACAKQGTLKCTLNQYIRDMKGNHTIPFLGEYIRPNFVDQNQNTGESNLTAVVKLRA